MIGLRSGLQDHQCFERLVKVLEQSPSTLLPDYIGTVLEAAFLFEKQDTPEPALVLAYAILRWQLQSEIPRSDMDIMIQNIQYINKSKNISLSSEEIEKHAIENNTHTLQSWIIRKGGAGLEKGISVGIPASSFLGVIKCISVDELNELGKALMKCAFPRFSGEFLDIELYENRLLGLIERDKRSFSPFKKELERLNAAKEMGAVELRRHRRFAGGDGRLPRSSYFSVCDDTNGEDSGTLCRELFGYTDPRIPGMVLPMNANEPLLKHLLSSDLELSPTAIVVALIAPIDAQEHELFKYAYREFLEEAMCVDEKISLCVLETSVSEVDIKRTLDLRQKATQEWFFETFQTGDGMFLSKPNGIDASSFMDMIPTLVHPELGGEATTHGIGTWLRTCGSVDALIFPSARSEFGVVYQDGNLFDSFGWNLIDYRSSHSLGLSAAEIIYDDTGWLDAHLPQSFAHREIELIHLTNRLFGPGFDGWETTGVAKDYESVRSYIYKSLL